MSAAKQLVTTVVVHDDAGDAHVFGPDSKEIPDWARKLIENPKAWGEDAPAEPRTAAAAVETASGEDSAPAKKAASAPAKKATAKKATAKKATAKKSTPASN